MKKYENEDVDQRTTTPHCKTRKLRSGYKYKIQNNPTLVQMNGY